MLQGEYGYNSTSFWDIVPSITFLLFIIALITNWKTQRQKLILFALALFIFAGVAAAFLLEPFFAEIIKTEQFNQYTLTESKFQIIFLNTEALHAVALFENTTIRDTFLIIDAVYINRFLKQK